MSQWIETTLGAAATEVTVGHVGPMAMHYQESGVPFLRSQNVREHRLDLSDVKFISPEFHSKLAKSRLRPGDVVTVRTGKPGTTSVVPESLQDANCSDLVITRPGPSVDAQWLSYYMNSAGVHFISSELVGAVQQHFNVGSAKKMVLSMPPLTEQRAIAEVLGALDDKIAANTKLAATADEYIRANLTELTVDIDDVISIGKLATNRKDLRDPTSLDPNANYVGLEHIPRRSMWLDATGTADSVTSTKAGFQPGDVLFGKLRPYFHKVVAAPFAGICSTDILVVTSNHDYLADFVLASIASDYVVERVTAASEGTRMPRTSWKDLAAVEVGWPGEEKARNFSARVAALRSSIESLIRESVHLAATRDALLPPLMSGKLRVKDANIIISEIR